MRRIVMWAMSTLTVLVLLFSYSTSRSSAPAVATAETRSATSSGQSVGSAGTADSADSSDSDGSADDGSPDDSATSEADTFAGDAVMTRFGAVQVQITVSDGQITAADVLQVPWQERHDQMINSRAVPIYNAAVLESQSADIDVVSGATVTWEGYTSSLQSAIDQANL